MRLDEQKLIDIMFEIAFAVRDNKSLRKMNNEKLAAWVAKQLKECGFETKPCGSSWGILWPSKRGD